MRYQNDELPDWHFASGNYVDPCADEVLPTWDQALDSIGPVDEPLRVARFGPKYNAQGVLAGSKDSARCIGYLTKYLTKQIAGCLVLLLLYGLRCGEVLGLRWADVDPDDGEIRVSQQIRRVSGELRIGPVNTSAARRNLPILPVAADVFGIRGEAQATGREELGQSWQNNGLVFTTKTDRPIEPRNLVRSFHRICDASGIRVIKVHHLRHATATLPGMLDRVDDLRPLGLVLFLVQEASVPKFLELPELGGWITPCLRRDGSERPAVAWPIGHLRLLMRQITCCR